MKTKTKIKLGCWYEDILLGIIGMAVQIVDNFTGCRVVSIVPRVENPQNVKGHADCWTLDENRLKLVTSSDYAPIQDIANKNKTELVLGASYMHEITGITGYCIGIAFGLREPVAICVLEYLDSERKIQRLTAPENLVRPIKTKARTVKSDRSNGPSVQGFVSCNGIGGMYGR